MLFHHKLSHYFLFIILGAFGFACEEENLQEGLNQTAVLDAYIFAGQGLDSLRITKSQNYLDPDTNVITLDDLIVTISDGSEVVPLRNIGNGYYQNLDFMIESGNTYEISFEYVGKQVTSSTYVPEKKEASISATRLELEQVDFGGGFPRGGLTGADPIDVSWDNTEGDYYYVVLENLNPEGEYVIPALAEENGIGPRFNFITEPSITDFYAINTRRDIQQYGQHRVIIFRVNPEYAALYQSSGNSSTTISSPPSNVKNGLGIFTGVSSDTLFFNVIKI